MRKKVEFAVLVLALAGLLALANVCFWVYDAALNNLIRAYALRMRPLLRRFL